jgi:hypothetical protein
MLCSETMAILLSGIRDLRGGGEQRRWLDAQRIDSDGACGKRFDYLNILMLIRIAW